MVPSSAGPDRTSSRTALMLLYGVSGFTLASWGSRLPAIRADAELSGTEIGVVVSALAAGTLVALFVSGVVVHRLGPARAIRLGAAACSAALLAAAFRRDVVVLSMAATVLGTGNSIYDVAMNVQATERARGWRQMPTLHGSWSIGALLGAVLGAVAAHRQLPLGQYLVAVAVVIAVLAVAGSVRFDRASSARPPVSRTGGGGTRRERLRAVLGRLFAPWRSRRTVALGLLALGAAFAEGTANDWLSLALVDRSGYAMSQQLAAAGLGVFVTGMIAGRFGFPLVRARRAERLLPLCAALVVLGTGLVLVGGLAFGAARPLPAGLVGGAGLFGWGLGASLGVPLAMAAAAHASSGARSTRAGRAARVSVVSTIGYAAFLGGPPALGALADDIGFLWVLLVAPAVMVVAFGLAAVLHPRGRRSAGRAGTGPQPGVDVGGDLLLGAGRRP